jgi:hypothetical protein
MSSATPIVIVTVHCELCGEPIGTREQDQAITTPEGWWCLGCATRIEDVAIAELDWCSRERG